MTSFFHVASKRLIPRYQNLPTNDHVFLTKRRNPGKRAAGFFQKNRSDVDKKDGKRKIRVSGYSVKGYWSRLWVHRIKFSKNYQL